MTGSPTSIEELFAMLHQFDEYPDGVAPTTEIIRGTAFFPGGFGLWNPAPPDVMHVPPTRGIMVIGHNFDSVRSYQRSLQRGAESPNGATWRHLLAFLRSVGIPYEQCFFTNAYVGLMEGESAVGKFPGAKDLNFVRWCQEFLALQIEMMRPRLILALGVHVPGFLAEMAIEHTRMWRIWRHVRSIAALNDDNASVHAAIFTQTKHTCPVVALIHPAQRPLNLKHRTYGTLVGNDAEVALVRAALEAGADIGSSS